MSRARLVLTALAVAAVLPGCRNEEMERRLADTQAELAAKDGQVVALARDLASTCGERDAARRDAERAQAEAESVRKELADAQKKLEDEEKDLDRVTAHRDELTEWIEQELLPVAEAHVPELAALHTVTDDMMKEVSRIRALPWKSPVMRRRVTRAQAGEWTRREMKKELPEEKARQIVVVGAELGLVQPGTDLYKMLGEFIEGGAAAFYKPETRTFYHIEGNDGRGAYPVVFHELVHALEDQYFDLNRFYRDIGDDTDRGLARRGLVEGSAALFQQVYQEDHPEDVKAMMKAQMTPEMIQKQMKMITSVPAFLVASMGLYPYQNGMRWVEQVTGRDPSKVAAIYADPPVSTEQVLHAEKWLDAAHRDYPHKVTPPDLSALPAAWERVEPDTMGELTTGCLLAQLRSPVPQTAVLGLLDDKTGGVALREPLKTAVEGWDGDSIVGAVDPGSGRATVVWVSVWDSEKDAQEFVDVYAPAVGKKVTKKKVDPLPSPIRFEEAGTERLSGIVREGTRVVAVLGAPGDRFDDLVKAGLTTKVEADPRDPADAGQAAAATPAADAAPAGTAPAVK